mmetsp:Transcript_42991/g.121550  ORF Transcript_42991/g.121550 Transcript_42991/m.121550 type:complete len:222 (-) Transcript_42991:328-993(-)
MRWYTSTTWSWSTRSNLLRRILSANAICRWRSWSSLSPSHSERRLRMLLVSTSVIVPSNRKCLAMSGVVRRVRTMGTGSAIPVVSTSTASRGLPFSICWRIESKAPRRSPRTVQHMQPFSMTTTCSAKSSAEFCNNSLSIGTAPNSFSMTANFLSRWCFKRWLSTVVFPAPKNPVKIVTGTGVFESRLLVGTSLTTDHFSSRTSPRTQAVSPALKYDVACS